MSDIGISDYSFKDNQRENEYNSQMSRAFEYDNQHSTAGKWHFESDLYIDSTIVCTNMISAIDEQVAIAQTARNSVIGQMKSPEGQDIEGDISSCFDDIAGGAQGVVASLSYILAWSVRRYSNGVTAGLISLGIANGIGIRF